MNRKLMILISTSFCKRSQDEDFNIIDGNEDGGFNESSLTQSFACGPGGCPPQDKKKGCETCKPSDHPSKEGKGSYGPGDCPYESGKESSKQSGKSSCGPGGCPYESGKGSSRQSGKPAGGSCGPGGCSPKGKSGSCSLFECDLSDRKLEKEDLNIDRSTNDENKKLNKIGGDIYDCNSGECKKLGTLNSNKENKQSFGKKDEFDSFKKGESSNKNKNLEKGINTI